MPEYLSIPAAILAWLSVIVIALIALAPLLCIAVARYQERLKTRRYLKTCHMTPVAGQRWEYANGKSFWLQEIPDKPEVWELIYRKPQRSICDSAYCLKQSWPDHIRQHRAHCVSTPV